MIDFIDMQRPESRGRVLDVLGEALQSDRARTRLIGMSELGLVQLTRKRTRPGGEAALTRTCPHCLGLGRVKSPETVAFEVLTEIGRLGPHASGGRVTVRVHPDVARALRLSLQTAGLPVSEGSSVDVRVEEDSSTLPAQFAMLAI